MKDKTQDHLLKKKKRKKMIGTKSLFQEHYMKHVFRSGVYCGPRPVLHLSLLEICSVVFVILLTNHPITQPTNQPTNQPTDIGKNLTFLVEKKGQSPLLYVFTEFCIYIVPNVSLNVQMFKEIHNFTQGNVAFHLVACHYNFLEIIRVRKEISE